MVLLLNVLHWMPAVMMGAQPYLTAPQPNMSLPHAGLPLVHNASHSSVFVPNAAACHAPRRAGCLGTYNHAPHITPLPFASAGGAERYIVAWHNAAALEDAPGSRVLCALSVDGGDSWGAASELFPALSDVQAPGTTARRG